MFGIRLAELDICIDNKYEYVEKMCEGYKVNTSSHDFSVCVTDEEITREEANGITNRGYLESLAIYRKIAETLTEYDGFLMHGVIIDITGTGVAFLAKSGTGKTTHTMLWKNLIGDKMTIVNGDKPIIRIIDGKVFAYGTPWAGKENIHSNMKTELKNICFIERSEENKCILTNSNEIFERLFPQIYRMSDKTGMIKTLDMIDTVMKKCRFYTIMCNMNPDAAEVAYSEIFS